MINYIEITVHTTVKLDMKKINIMQYEHSHCDNSYIFRHNSILQYSEERQLLTNIEIKKC